MQRCTILHWDLALSRACCISRGCASCFISGTDRSQVATMPMNESRNLVVSSYNAATGSRDRLAQVRCLCSHDCGHLQRVLKSATLVVEGVITVSRTTAKPPAPQRVLTVSLTTAHEAHWADAGHKHPALCLPSPPCSLGLWASSPTLPCRLADHCLPVIPPQTVLELTPRWTLPTSPLQTRKQLY